MLVRNIIFITLIINLDYIVFSCCRIIHPVLFRRRIFVAGWCAMNLWLVSLLWLSAHMFLVRWPWRWWKGLSMGWVVCDVHLPFVFFEAPDPRLWRNEVGYFCRSGVLNFGGNELTVRWRWPWLLSVLSSSSLWMCSTSPSSYCSILGDIQIRSVGNTTSDP
jgi:hypothetical protein